MQLHFSKIVKSVHCCIIILFILCGCSSNEQVITTIQDNTSSITLRVLTEQTISDGMNQQAELLLQRFQEENPHVNIQLEYLPILFEERSAYLDALHAQMEEGSGPDIFLFPTSNTIITDSPRSYTYTMVDLLFPDVEKAMRNGFFADISQFYDDDTALGKPSLSQKIMDAGTVGNSRYVLPLRFDIPTIYVFSNTFNILEDQTDISEYTIKDWMQLAIAHNDASLACGIKYTSINAFSSLIDYNQRKVTLSTATVEDYFSLFNQLEDTIAGTYHQITADLYNITEVYKNYPAQLDPLSSSMAYAALAQSKGLSLSMYPVRSIEGDIIATISYYGAISSNSPNAELCYQFLRMFLEEDSQWELNCPEPQHKGLIESGWPVRVVGSVEPLWENLRTQMKNGYNPYKSIKLCDASIPILDSQIDIVRFPFSNNYKEVLHKLYSGHDISICAEELVANLQP